MIAVKGITKYYGSFKALDDVSFDVDAGEIVAFLGPNGAGKTTAMRIITGFMPPTAGDVSIDGRDVFEEPMEVKRVIGYLPENPPLYPEMTVTEYLDFVARLKKVPAASVKNEVERVIGLTDLKERRDTLISNLSKGLRQRVGIAQSIVNSPKVLILDEPTIGLDPRQVIDIRVLIRRLAREEHYTIILSTHMLSEASEICEKAVIINNGKIIKVDAIANLKNIPSEHFIITVQAVRDHEAVMAALKGMEGVAAVGREGDVLTVNAASDIREAIAKAVVESGAGLVQLGLREVTLEDAFIKLVQ